MRRFTGFVAGCMVLFLSVADLSAGAWTQKKGAGYAKVGFRFVRADRFYEPDGNKIDIATLGDYVTSFYGEYGLTDRFTVVASVPFFRRITLNRQQGTSGFVFFEGDSKSGFSDADVGLRIGLLQGETVLSAEFLLGIPLGDDSQANGLLTGDGELNQLLKLELGHSFYPAPIYFNAGIGVNNRSQGYSDEFHYSAEVGYTFNQRFLLAAKVRGIRSFKNGDDAFTGGMGGLFANNQSYLAYGPEASFFLTQKFGVSAGVEGAAFGENVLSAPVFSFGIFLQ